MVYGSSLLSECYVPYLQNAWSKVKINMSLVQKTVETVDSSSLKSRSLLILFTWHGSSEKFVSLG